MTKLPTYNGKYIVDMDCWTISFAKTINEQIKPSDRYPIFVPSYNRYNDNAIFISIMRDYSTWPVFVIVRKSQYDNYVKSYNCSHITIIPIDDNKITDAGMAHAACINVSESDNLFVIDDDIIPHINAEAINIESNKIKSMPVYGVQNFDLIFAFWQCIHEHLINKYTNCCCTTIEDKSFNFDVKSIYDLSYGPHKFMCGVCFNKQRLNNLNYRSCSVYGHDDIDLMFQLAQNSYFPLSIKPLTFTSNKYGNWGYNTLDERLISQFEMLNSNWGDCSYVKLDENKKIFTIDFKKFFNLYPHLKINKVRNLSKELGCIKTQYTLW